jgi:GTP-binding protein
MFSRNAQIEFIKSCPFGFPFPEPMPFEVAFTGRSNVGKSSLINSLTGMKNLARVSSRPGCTQAVNYFKVDGRFFLADLPGYGYAKAPKQMVIEFGELMKDYFEERAEWMMGVSIIDVRRGVLDLDLDMINLFLGYEIPFLAVVTKVDKLKKQQKSRAMQSIRNHPALAGKTVLAYSSLTGEGRKELNKALDDLLVEKKEKDAH